MYYKTPPWRHMTTPPAEIGCFGNSFRSALFTWTNSRGCLYRIHTKPPPAGFGGPIALYHAPLHLGPLPLATGPVSRRATSAPSHRADEPPGTWAFFKAREGPRKVEIIERRSRVLCRRVMHESEIQAKYGNSAWKVCSLIYPGKQPRNMATRGMRTCGAESDIALNLRRPTSTRYPLWTPWRPRTAPAAGLAT